MLKNDLAEILETLKYFNLEKEAANRKESEGRWFAGKGQKIPIGEDLKSHLETYLDGRNLTKPNVNLSFHPPNNPPYLSLHLGRYSFMNRYGLNPRKKVAWWHLNVFLKKRDLTTYRFWEIKTKTGTQR